MPPAPHKFARTSIEGWNRKRSVSPAATSSSNAHKGIVPNVAPVPTHVASVPTHDNDSHAEDHFVSRRSDDGLFYEEEYQDELIQYLLVMEASHLAHPELMDQQPELQWRMRPYLIDFIVEIHAQFRLRPEVLYLAINIFDRYVSKRVVYKKHYQLVGCASLWIAAKFEDSKDRVPAVREFYEMCCGAYEQSAFIQMEGHILTTIAWATGPPTAEAWLRHLVLNPESTRREDVRVQNVARFLMELTLFHRQFVGRRSSLIAFGALSLARVICGKQRRAPPSFIADDEQECTVIAEQIDMILHDRLDSVSDILCRKYASAPWSRASIIVREFYLSGRRFAAYPTPPSTPFTPSLPTPTLSASSWASKRSTCVTASPAASTFSCASSDADDEPVTPITPIERTRHPSDYVSAKENIAPVNTSCPAVRQNQNKALPAMPPPAHPASNRSVLHSVHSSRLDVPARAVRRQSN